MNRSVVAAVAALAFAFAAPISVHASSPSHAHTRLAKPSWCHSLTCWDTVAGAEEWIERLGANTVRGRVWAGTGGSHLNVDSAVCVGVLRYGVVRVNVGNIDKIIMSHAETKGWDGGSGWPIGETAYRVLRCSFVDGAGGYHRGLYSAPKDAFFGN